MPIEPGATTLALTLGTLFYCVASGFIPVMNAELYLLAVSAVLPAELVVPVILLATIGQMAAKSLMYLAGRGAVRLPGGRVERMLQRMHAHVDRRRDIGGLLIFVSAASGLPPFYVVSVASGAAAFDFGRFALAGFAGRLLRFSAIVLFPHAVRSVL